ncbi:DUF547 domain-containing protein [Aureibaculum sp. 2210JD6-5]|uniref:DUF547 domain-containing protein n=1 Tax=Aureibaculum sp. 2210JD6-5 TaxID=3103957 RepID=UPI002AACD09A|nr:DUF547 domain-containing protein [Aureibaculum sp. 2210JD6-5]MDY7395125.1 DUF547 domain-containing protein [Aureibaculum sp. 2210JD6-5]
MKHKIKLLLVLFSFNLGFSQGIDTFFSKTDTFLKTYVSDGKVDYDAIKKNPDKLNEILKIAKAISIEKTDADKYQAFWINAYNISVIKGIIDNYPIKSPLDKAGFFDRIKHEVGGKKITLNDIEHKLLRAQFKDPRFHFVLVCGAVGCPPLISKAYMPNTLDAQLEQQTKLSINGSFIKVDTKKKKVLGSEILKWYKEDFTMDGKKEIDFLNKYRTEKIPSNFKLGYFTYNWKLNKQ